MDWPVLCIIPAFACLSRNTLYTSQLVACPKPCLSFVCTNNNSRRTQILRQFAHIRANDGETVSSSDNNGDTASKEEQASTQKHNRKAIPDDNGDLVDPQEMTRMLEQTLFSLTHSANVLDTSRSCNIKAHPSLCPSERWLFLIQLPHRLLRDIGFVLASPSLLLDSDELPTVSGDMTGESSSSWQKAAEWLQKLPVEQVIKWFETHRYSTRLGDHFALCIEYILRFGPLLRVERLLISEQVSERFSPDSPSMKMLERVNKGYMVCGGSPPNGISRAESEGKSWEGSFSLPEFASYKMFDSTITSSLQNADHLQPKPESPVLNRHYKQNELSSACNVSGIMADNNMTFLEDIEGIKGERNENTYGQHLQLETCNQNHGLLTRDVLLQLGFLDGCQDLKFSNTVGLELSGVKRRKRKLAKVVRPYFEDNFTSISMYYASPRRESSSSFESRKKRHKRKKPVVKLEQIASGKPTVVTVGEFDFLFQCQIVNKREDSIMRDSNLDSGRCMEDECNFSVTDQAHQGSMTFAGKTVHHWEASVQFLLFAGPWEVFGLVTPSYAAWRSTKSTIFFDSEGVPPGSMSPFFNAYIKALKQDQRLFGSRIFNFDMFYIGPHGGEDLNYRKWRMRSQLALCHHANSSSIFHKLLTQRVPDASGESDGVSIHKLASKNKGMNHCEARKSVSGDVFDVSKNSLDHVHELDIEDRKTVRVFPRALVQGYLFYEYDLWYLLCLQRSIIEIDSATPKDVDTHKNCPGKVSDGYNTIYDQTTVRKFGLDVFQEFGFSPNHWMGWWCRIKDFQSFACSASHKDHMWYIVPKKEWLSPVVIEHSDAMRCKHIFSVENFLLMAEKVAQEASEMEKPRKRRFMLAEVKQVFNLFTSADNEQVNLENNRKGHWVEVSRGFVMEDTWPESKWDKPHGFSFSWSYSLLGVNPDNII